jgi:hypothetical protein
MSGVFVIWGGVKVAASSIPLALLMFAIGGGTVVLVLRMMLGGAAVDRFESTGEISKEHFDYLIWASFLVPMLLVVALLALAITGGLTNR